jgi:acetylornithine/N-succinyldiaminopimelate aminotransferase
MTSQTEAILSMAEQYLMSNYGQRTVALVRGCGVNVWDSDGRQFVDLLCGLGVNNLGHCHPKVVEAIQRQAETLLHVSNLYLIEPQVQLAKLLVENSPADKAFFCNSGTEAVEAAIKMARRYSYEKFGAGRHKIVAMENSFHGRTMGSLSATGQAKYHKGFEPMLDGFIHVPVNDLDALIAAVDDTVCAIIVEPVMGEGGIYPVNKEYLQGARELCDRRNMLLIFDEVQCGMGRTGYLFALEDSGVEPDAIALAKGLAGGVPIGAMLAKKEAASVMTAGSHAATFGGNPLSSAAGVAAMNVYLDEKLPQRSKELGGRFMGRLDTLKNKYPKLINEVRGRGLMVGVDLTFPAADAVAVLRDKGYIVGVAGPNVLRFLPPLIVDESILNTVVDLLDVFFAGRS